MPSSRGGECEDGGERQPKYQEASERPVGKVHQALEDVSVNPVGKRRPEYQDTSEKLVGKLQRRRV